MDVETEIVNLWFKKVYFLYNIYSFLKQNCVETTIYIVQLVSCCVESQSGNDSLAKIVRMAEI